MATITCPDDCAGALPPVNFDFCAPQWQLSEINAIYIAKENAAPFEDVEDAAEWTARLSQTLTTLSAGGLTADDLIRPLTVTAGQPAPTPVTKDLPNGQKANLGKDRTITGQIMDASPENHAMIQRLECGGKYRIWYGTTGGLLFGGNSGIIVDADANMVLSQTKDDLLVYNVTMTWRARQTEEFVQSPIAA